MHPFHGPCVKEGDATQHGVCSDGFTVGRQVEMCHRVALILEHGKNLEVSYPTVYLTVEGHPPNPGSFKYNAYLLHFCRSTDCLWASSGNRTAKEM